MTRPGGYPAELRERAVRTAFEHRKEFPSTWAAIKSISMVGWQASRSLRTDLAVDALEMAIWAPP